MSDADITLPPSLRHALTLCIDDTSAPFANDAVAAAARLAMSADVRPYQRYMTECKELGVAMADLKKVIKKRIEEVEQAELESQPLESSSLMNRFLWSPYGLQMRANDGATRLTNFKAKIITETVIDDGVSQQRQYEIEATVMGETMTARIPASEFASLAWVHTHLGARAVILPGPGMRDATRAAIQAYSMGRRLRRAYGHTGWRLLEDDAWAYLHAGGAVIAEALLDPAEMVTAPTIIAHTTTTPSVAVAPPDPAIVTATNDSTPAPAKRVEAQKPEPRVIVELPGQLARFELPEPPVGDARRAAIHAVLRMIRLLPRVMFPLIAFAHRAVLSPVDFAIWLMGPTGAFKSEIATLVMQMLGRRWDRRSLPLSWTATPTAIETLLFMAKDAFLIIDDFAPRGSAMERDRLHALGERILRSLGNGSTRSRGNADGGLRVDHPPRASVVITGEERPRGQSAQARCLIVELTHGEITSAELSRRQAEGSSGLYSQAMAGYILRIGQRLVAGNPPRVVERARELRALATSGEMHRRTPGVAADLGVGLEEFLAYALESGAITATDRDALWAEGWGHIGVAAASQADHHAEEEPAQAFLRLLGSAVATGRAHLTSTSGDEPADSRRWGWRPMQVGESENMRPGGDQIGWIELGGAKVYLEPDASYRVAQNYASDHGLAVSAATLRKRLHERGLLASTETRGGKVHLLVRRTLQGQRREVLHVKWPEVTDEASKTKAVAPDVTGPVEVADFAPPTQQGDLFEAAEEEGT